MLRHFGLSTLALTLSSPAIAAPPQQVGGWTIETFQNPAEKADFTVRMKKVVGNAIVTYRISSLVGEGVYSKIGDCYSSSGFSLYDDSGNPLPRGTAIKKGMSEYLSGLSDGCKTSSVTNTQLLAGIEQAVAAADARFKAERPKPDLTPKASGAGGWAFKDTASLGSDGVTVEHLLSMSRTVGGLKLSYEINVVPGDSYGSIPKTMKASLRDCTYEDNDSSDFLDVGRRAKDIREKIKTNLPSSMYGCDVTDADVAAALIGFEPAYIALDKWMVDRVDERKLMLRAAQDFADSEDQRL